MVEGCTQQVERSPGSAAELQRGRRPRHILEYTCEIVHLVAKYRSRLVERRRLFVLPTRHAAPCQLPQRSRLNVVVSATLGQPRSR